MTHQPKVSVIIPIYKAEAYLYRCLDSILAQTLSDFEIILVDDGSPDHSGAICDEYAQRDSRIRVFHKKNGGVASARQLGTDNAVGKYSIHCDPDDWVEPEMLQKMYLIAEKEDADVVMCDFMMHSPKGTYHKSQQPVSLSPEDILRGIIGPELQGSMCNRLIRHSLYKKYGIHYFEGINYCEDNLIWMQLYQHDIKTSYIGEAFYHYEWGEGNHITMNNDLQTWQSLMNYHKKALEMMPAKYAELIKEMAIPCIVSGFIKHYLKAGDYRLFKLTNEQIKQKVDGKRISICMRLIQHIGYYNAYRLYCLSDVFALAKIRGKRQ